MNKILPDAYLKSKTGRVLSGKFHSSSRMQNILLIVKSSHSSITRQNILLVFTTLVPLCSPFAWYLFARSLRMHYRNKDSRCPTPSGNGWIAQKCVDSCGTNPTHLWSKKTPETPEYSAACYYTNCLRIIHDISNKESGRTIKYKILQE